jgi:hypothetical protein
VTEKEGTLRINRAIGVIVAIGVLADASHALADSGAAVPFPIHYREWAVTRSFVSGPESQTAGFHHYYANDKALEGFATGKFPDGSVIVDERLAVEQRGGSSFEGNRIGVAVMMKQSRRYAQTGGWGFDAAVGDSQTLGASAETRAAAILATRSKRAVTSY